MSTITNIRNFMSKIQNKKLPNYDFFYNYNHHLQQKVLNLNDYNFREFKKLLRIHNIYIAGYSLLYYKLGLDQYDNKLDLFISISELQSFLDKFYKSFNIISINFTSKYYTLDENIIEVIFNSNDLQIYLHIYNNLDIDAFIKNKLSIFGIWWNTSEDNIHINDITALLFSPNGKMDGIYQKPSNLTLSDDDEVLLESKNIYISYPSIQKQYNPNTNYEKMIIIELIVNLGKYLFTDSTYQPKILLRTLQFIIYMYNINSNIYTYDVFYKTFMHFSNIFHIPIKINTYIDKVIREQILNKYQIEITFDDENNIKFVCTDLEYDRKLNENDEKYIKQVLLFYYKRKIYKDESKNKFLDLILHIHKLPITLFNINTDTNGIKKEIYDILLSNHDANININGFKTEITYHDLYLGENITDVEQYIKDDDDNIIIVDPDIKTATCISKSNLDMMINNYMDNWFYDCSEFISGNYLSNPYIKVSISSGNYYIHYKYLYSLFKSNNRLFYINKPYETIATTATYKNTPIGQKNGVSDIVGAFYCNDHTSIKISTISTIASIKIPSISKKSNYNSRIEKISFNKPYPISLNR